MEFERKIFHLPAAKVTISCSPFVHSARGFGTTYLQVKYY